MQIVTDEKVIDEVRAIFGQDHFATMNGAVIEEFGECYAKCSVQLTKQHMNAMGGVMGGVHYMLADFAFAVANNWKERRTVSLHSDIAYLGAVKGKKLIAEAHCLKDGRSTCYYQVLISDELDNQVAVANITGFKK